MNKVTRIIKKRTKFESILPENEKKKCGKDTKSYAANSRDAAVFRG